MSRETHEITRDELMSMADYGQVRLARRTAISATKKNRRVHVGPDATAYFESFDTMWHQIHEMLYIEKGGEGQIADELSAYNPLIPKGRELVCTLMFEVDDENRRARLLAKLGGVENTVSLSFAGEKIHAVAEDDVDRTTAEGKASSIQFLHFPFSAAQVEKFSQPGCAVVFAIGHEAYGHMAQLPEDVRAALTSDFD